MSEEEITNISQLTSYEIFADGVSLGVFRADPNEGAWHTFSFPEVTASRITIVTDLHRMNRLHGYPFGKSNRGAKKLCKKIYKNLTG